MNDYNIEIDEGLMDIMPSFIELTEQDMQALSSAIEGNDLETVKKLAHTLKGDSGGYGFEEMSRIAKSLELSVKEGDGVGMKQNWSELSAYWEQVKITFNQMNES